MGEQPGYVMICVHLLARTCEPTRVIYIYIYI